MNGPSHSTAKEQQRATERSTALGVRKELEIVDNMSVFVWVHWWVVCGVGVCGGVLLCGCKFLNSAAYRDPNILRDSVYV